MPPPRNQRRSPLAFSLPRWTASRLTVVEQMRDVNDRGMFASRQEFPHAGTAGGQPISASGQATGSCRRAET